MLQNATHHPSCQQAVTFLLAEGLKARTTTTWPGVRVSRRRLGRQSDAPHGAATALQSVKQSRCLRSAVTGGQPVSQSSFRKTQRSPGLQGPQLRGQTASQEWSGQVTAKGTGRLGRTETQGSSAHMFWNCLHQGNRNLRTKGMSGDTKLGRYRKALTVLLRPSSLAQMIKQLKTGQKKKRLLKKNKQNKNADTCIIQYKYVAGPVLST